MKVNLPYIPAVREFAKEAHESIGQKRKDGGPYYEHPEAVAGMVQDLGMRSDMVAAALLHDILEDVYPVNKFYSPKLIKEEFGADVLGMVFGLTDIFTKQAFPQYNRKERKSMEAMRLSAQPDEVKIIKMADIWHNGLTLDNVGGFGGVWAQEKRELVPLLEPKSMKYSLAYQTIYNKITL